MIQVIIITAILVLANLTLRTSDARAQAPPQVGTFGAADLEQARSQGFDVLSIDTVNGCLGDETADGFGPAGAFAKPLGGAGTYSDNDAAHYARGSVLVVLVFVNHDGGSWSTAERQAQGAKAYEAKQFYLDHVPSEAFLTFDHETSEAYYYYTATLPYDIADFGNFQNGMITDAAEDLGFSDDDGDGSVIDEMTIWLQGWNGGWDNVIAVFIPADYHFTPAQAGWTTSWCKVSPNMSWGTLAHEWGHVFGACDEGGSPAGCNNLDCDDVCMSYYLVDQVPNGNCTSCAGGVECIMRGWVGGPPCTYTYRNWAWMDANGDGRMDNTIGWDRFADSTYEIWELYHAGWMIHTNTTWGMVANQKWTSWGVMGVRSRGASDYAISVFGDNNLNHHLAAEYLAPGVRFVVGDFNHNNLGQDFVRVVNGGGAGQYVVSHEAGNTTLHPDGAFRSYSWDDRDVVRAYDLPLFAGETIRILADPTTVNSGLDLGIALFKSNGGTYYAPRTSAVMEADAFGADMSESITYEVPQDDVYGLVVWSNSEVDGTFRIQVGPSMVELAEAVPFWSAFDLRLFSYVPYTNYWAVSGSRIGAPSNHRLSLFEESTFQTELAVSGAYPAIEFIAADYNPGTSTDYLRVARQSGGVTHITEWEQGSDILAGFEDDTWAANHIVKVWDAHLRAGQTYRIQQYSSFLSPVDAGIYLMSSANGDRYIQRSGAAAGSNGHPSALTEWFDYTAPADDWYGVVMMANDDSEGAYTIGVGPYEVLAEQTPFEVPDELIWADIATVNGSWAVVGVRPEAGSVSSMFLWDCEDRTIGCFRDGDTSSGGVRYIVMDGNHDPATTYHARAERISGVGSHAVSFDVAPENDVSYDDLSEVETASGTFVAGEVVQIRDLNVAAAPVALTITVVPFAPGLDVSVAVFDSQGGSYIQSPDLAIAKADDAGPGLQERIMINADHGDIYGLVVTNQSGAPGNYEIHIHETGLSAAGDAAAPPALALLPNAPNPFSRSTAIRFSLPAQTEVDLTVYDLQGRRVRSLLDGELTSAGEHGVEFDGRDDFGRELAAGVYLYTMAAEGRVEKRKLTLMR